MTKRTAWSSYLEGDHELNSYTSREEAVDAIKRRIDCEFPPDKLVTYRVSRIISSIEVLNNKVDQITDAVWDTINDQLAIETDVEDDPIWLDPHDLQQLGANIVAFITEKGNADYWTVDDGTVEECVYRAGSKENPTTTVGEVTRVNLFRQLTDSWMGKFK